MESAEQLSPIVGTLSACQALEVSRASLYRKWSQAKAPVQETKQRAKPSHALSEEERQAVLDVLHCERFVDKAPQEIYSCLLDEEIYLCSISTMYRILRSEGEVRERRNQLRHPKYKKPELLATGPNQVWSWDITKLKGPVKWTYFYLYVILDIFSRYVVGWMVAHRESAQLAKRLMSESCRKQQIEEGQLTIHSDRGPSMKSKAVALMLSDLGVTKTHSRPYVSDDNPFSESQFKTLKYRPEFPELFGCIQDARSFCSPFFQWYNQEHYHSGVAMLTPEIVHYGQSAQIIEKRSQTLLTAYGTHPERFRGKIPTPTQLPKAVWINPPSFKKSEEKKDSSTGLIEMHVVISKQDVGANPQQLESGAPARGTVCPSPTISDEHGADFVSRAAKPNAVVPLH